MKESKPQRDYFGEALAELAVTNQKLFALTADLESSLRMTEFSQKFPRRFFNVGVAEQNLVGVAVGLSLEGMVPFCGSFAVFLPGRCFDQIRVSVCQSQANVKLVGGHLGFSNAGDGASAQAIEDLALMRSLPGMVVLAPFDGRETKKLVKLAVDHKGPVYLRISKTEVPGEVKSVLSGQKWQVGGSRLLKRGEDLTILGHGPILNEVLLAAKVFGVEVIDVYSLKPLDKKTILKSGAKTGKVLVVEEHSVYGGLGSVASELLSQEYPLPVKVLAVPDVFGESARSWQELLKKYKMERKAIAEQIKLLIE